MEPGQDERAHPPHTVMLRIPPTPTPPARERLLRRLDSAERIALVVGVDGSGRSTLALDWARRQQATGAEVLWLPGLDSFRDPRAVWEALLGAEDNDPRAGAGPTAASDEQILDRLARRLNSSAAPIVIVADGASQWISDRHVEPLVRLLAQTTTVRFVLFGFFLPAFPPHLRITQVSNAELRMRPNELVDVAKAEGLQVSREFVAQVAERFGGWLLPSILALRVAHDRRAPGREQSKVHALALEQAMTLVRERSTSELALVMMRPLWEWALSGILSEESAMVAWDVSSPHTGIAALEDAGMVVPVAGSEPSLWHSNLSPALTEIVEQEMSARFADDATAIEIRLATWDINQNRISDGMTHALRSADWDLVVDLLGKHWAALANTSTDVLRDIINALPESILADNGQWSAAKNYLNYLPSAGDPRPTLFVPPVQTDASLLNRIAAATSQSAAHRIATRFEDGAETARYAALQLAQASPAELGEVHHILADLRLQWSMSLLLAGDIGEAALSYESTFDEALAYNNTRMVVEAAGSLALIHTLRGDFRRADAWMLRLPDYEPQGPLDTVTAPGEMARAHLAIDALDLDAAREIMGGSLENARAGELWAIHAYLRSRLTMITGDAVLELVDIRSDIVARTDNAATGGLNAQLLLLAQAELLSASEQPLAARELVEAAAVPPTAPLAELSEIALARACLLVGDMDRAAAVVSRQLESVTSGPRVVAELLAIASIIELRADDSGRAVDHFRRSLALARTHNSLAIFARIPASDVEVLLQKAQATLPDAAWRTLSAANRLHSAAGQKVALTAREKDVLALLVEGASVDEIAGARFVTRNTVKSQLRSIYRKLGTNSREETIRVSLQPPGR